MRAAALCTIGLVVAAGAGAMELKKEVDLNGAWRFEIGEKTGDADPLLDDSRWETIQAPGRWEDQGFPGYNGFAWYRKSFSVPGALRTSKLFLDLGTIDDVDRTWINGHLLNGRGTLHPEYQTAYALQRLYYVPPEFLRFDGLNVVAVQVYDDYESGGITSGDLGLYAQQDFPELVVDLSGYWSFHTGDDPAWRLSPATRSGWDSLIVPLRWELQGYAGYDGYAWYRRSVVIGTEHQGERLLLALGRIDDIDEVFFNGQRIGGTGHFPTGHQDLRYNSWWQLERYYPLPPERIHWGQPNTIAVRVYDVWVDGGIYEGVVGVMTRKSWQRSRPDLENPLLDMLKKWWNR